MNLESMTWLTFAFNNLQYVESILPTELSHPDYTASILARLSKQQDLHIYLVVVWAGRPVFYVHPQPRQRYKPGRNPLSPSIATSALHRLFLSDIFVPYAFPLVDTHSDRHAHVGCYLIPRIRALLCVFVAHQRWVVQVLVLTHFLAQELLLSIHLDVGNGKSSLPSGF